MESQPANITDIFGATTEKELRALFNPSANYIRVYAVLDSKYRLIDDTRQDLLDHYTFYYSVSRNESLGSFRTVNPLANVVSMKMYKTRIPNIPTASAGSRRVSVAIEEFTAQSCVLANGGKAHWILGTEDVADSHCTDMVIENFNDGIFNFTIPINVVDKLTLTFGDPINRISWFNDRDTCTITYGANTILTTTLPHNFNVIKAGYTFVTFSNFTTANPNVDKTLIDYFNNNEIVGLLTGPNTIELLSSVTSVTPTAGVPLNTASLTPLPPGTLFDIYYEERRIFMPIEFLCLPE